MKLTLNSTLDQVYGLFAVITFVKRRRGVDLTHFPLWLGAAMGASPTSRLFLMLRSFLLPTPVRLLALGKTEGAHISEAYRYLHL